MFAPRKLTFSALMATCMSLLIGSAIMTTKVGFGPDWWPTFIGTAPVAFAVALPVGVFVTPIAEWVVTLLFGRPDSGKGERA